MPTIMPVADLRNYGEVLREVGPGKPVFLTRNDRGRYAVVDIDDWNRIEAARALVTELDRGRASAHRNVNPAKTATCSPCVPHPVAPRSQGTLPQRGYAPESPRTPPSHAR